MTDLITDERVVGAGMMGDRQSRAFNPTESGRRTDPDRAVMHKNSRPLTRRRSASRHPYPHRGDRRLTPA